MDDLRVRKPGFLSRVRERTRIAGGDEVFLDVTRVGEACGVFVQGMCGWMQGLRRVREGQSAADAHEGAAEETEEGVSEAETEFVQ